MTIAAWVYLDDRYRYNIVAEYIGGLRYFSAGKPSTGKLLCMLYDENKAGGPGNIWPVSDDPVPEDQWAHVALVVEAGVGYRYYIDGEESGSDELPGVRLYNYTSSNTKYLGIAHFSPNDKFDGKMDNVMVFNRALSDSEIKYLYESTDEDDLTEVVHDDAGNLILDHRGYSYAYDYENRLIRIEKRGDGGDPDTVAQFEYDALGRRIQKYDAVADEDTYYYYNAKWQVLAEHDGTSFGNIYVYGNYIDEMLVMTDGTNDYYYAHDHLQPRTFLLP